MNNDLEVIYIQAREFKDFVYGEFARIGKAISSPKRIELLDLLTQGPKTVEALAADTQMSIANTSKHLQTLLDAKLVTYSKDKNYVIYRLASEQVLMFVFALRGTAEDRISEVNIVREAHILRENSLSPISFAELAEKMNRNAITLLDVRPMEEYRHDHLPHALSVPISELEDRLDSLPKDKEIVAYCRGPYCVYATEAVELLKAKGFRATLLEAGINEWKQIQH
ncbi:MULTISPECIES: ArsR/SmtB family transcription factor [Mesobacillus]|uniref:Rhodanese-related sulfurtransferase/DNA-binding transcriptional ArsR family regulator n=1 Tax=Mesobacillus stamsii TaxID=225347 RepID=A0ABU0FU58_9BACI|nr:MULTISPECIES: metalloregulator ArsR/SmtB family transcription factor [Mesobacillus]MDQ0413444.1 rhodanese-related sulfurtransferase/DNA-binding transcriptional ArsR family regulator [Mesobacillus stamsii]